MAFTKQEIARLYHQRAGNYNFTANLYYLLGVRQWAYRRQAVQSLHLDAGDTVVEIGCDTGLNFGLLHREVGAQGKIIGVDLTPGMLIQARKRIEHHQWSNVELVQTDAASYIYPTKVDGILSTFAMTLIPEYDEVIQKGAEALACDKRFTVLDLTFSEHWPKWNIQLLIATTRPFGITSDLANRHPWESIRHYLTEVEFQKFYFGGAYLCVGVAS